MLDNTEVRKIKERHTTKSLFNPLQLKPKKNQIKTKSTKNGFKRGCSKSFIEERYIPLTLDEKVDIMEDLNESSNNRFKHYSKIFDRIKAHLNEINHSFQTTPLKPETITNDEDVINLNNKSFSPYSWTQNMNDDNDECDYKEEEINVLKLNRSRCCKSLNKISNGKILNWNITQSDTLYKTTTMPTTSGRGYLNTNTKDDFYDENKDNDNENRESCCISKSINCKCLLF
jgi:hypothetical protein